MIRDIKARKCKTNWFFWLTNIFAGVDIFGRTNRLVTMFFNRVLILFLPSSVDIPPRFSYEYYLIYYISFIESFKKGFILLPKVKGLEIDTLCNLLLQCRGMYRTFLLSSWNHNLPSLIYNIIIYICILGKHLHIFLSKFV